MMSVTTNYYLLLLFLSAFGLRWAPDLLCEIHITTLGFSCFIHIKEYEYLLYPPPQYVVRTKLTVHMLRKKEKSPI